MKFGVRQKTKKKYIQQHQMTQIHYFKIQIPKGTATQHILIISNKHILILVRTTNRHAYTHRLSIVVSVGDIPNQHSSLSSTQNISNNEP